MRIAFLLFSFFQISFSQYIPYNNRVQYAKKAAIVASSPEAVKIGLEVLKNGGNAFDAAVAVAFSMAVTYPQAGNIGGGGFLVCRKSDGTVFTIDYRETAPKKAFEKMYQDEKGNVIPLKSLYGSMAIGIPGTVDGFWQLHQKYGQKKWSNLIQPAISLAKNSFPISHYLAYSLNRVNEKVDTLDASYEEFKRLYRNDSPFKSGDRLQLKDLGKSLERIAKFGRDGFYKGKTATLISQAVQKHGGILTMEDLANYRAKFRNAIRFNYRNYEIVSMPPPSSGGVALFGILKSFEKFDPKSFPYGSAAYTQLFSEICRQVYADRSEFLGDPDFEKLPMKKLLSPSYIRSIVDGVRFGKSHRTSNEVHAQKKLVYESDETTHFCIIDKDGNMVSNTFTLNNSYGSLFIPEGTGIIMNDEMDDFSSKPGVPNFYGLIGNEKNAIEAGKRMLSSMTPSLVLKDNKPFMIVGSPGGSKIITTVAQAIIRVIDYQFDIDRAVNLDRIHHQWLPDKIFYENFALSPDSKELLKLWGYDLEKRNVIGDCHGILIKNGAISIGISSRGNGYALGY